MKADEMLQKTKQCKQNVKQDAKQNVKQKVKQDVKQKAKQDIRKGRYSVHSFIVMCLITVAALGMIVCPNLRQPGEQKQVYAASDGDESGGQTLPSGLAGVVSGVEKTAVTGTTVNRIGTSCEKVMVGQRVRKIDRDIAEFDVSASMASTVDALESAAFTMAENPGLMSDTDYDTLLRIVEAEAGGEDLKGRILVANVIMNRVKHEEFPDTVTEVVWECKNGVPQFSPTYDGRISEVTVSEETKEAVKQVLEGVDYSEGALFFIQKSAAEAHNVTWFEKDLKRLFKHGVHDFYTYPDESEDAQGKDGTSSDDNLVQMVKK
ncbi:MAG: cell wall hydrolase [Eubacteriales bacterium]|nr:cell wall hydrolase [Eubacteriales bacterium]